MNRPRRAILTRLNAAAPLLAVLVLVLIGIWQWQRPSPGDARHYHAQVYALIERAPMQIAGWQGHDTEPPAEAVQLLQPNGLLSRTYTDPDTGQQASLIIVHTRDARDMAGHYPPNCYPANGWTPAEQREHTWQLNDQTITGMDYRYTLEHAGQQQSIRVANFMILPDGRFAQHMNQLRDAAADYTRYFYGAGQVQLITDARMDTARRDAIFQRMLAENEPLITLMLSGMQVVDQSHAAASPAPHTSESRP